MYLKNTSELQPIADGYKQTFQNKFTTSISKNQIIKMKDEGVLTDRDLEIAKLLFNFRFATLEQIYDYLKYKGILTQKVTDDKSEVRETSITSIKSRLDKLVQNRVLNKFMLSTVELDKMESDALVIYCLDLGGKFLLTNYSNEDTSDWFVAINRKSSNLISKDILSVQFYLRLMQTCGDRVKYFEMNPLRKCDKTNIIPSFEFCIEYNGVPNYIVCEVVREFDLPIHFSKKIEKLERLVKTNAWRKYYFDTEKPPVLFIFTESDVLAQDVARIISNTTEIDRYRISTDKRINGNLTTAFMKYTNENKLALVKSSIF